MNQVKRIATILLTAMSLAAAAATDVTFLMCYRPDHPEDPSTKQILRYTAKHPQVRPLQWGGLTLPGAGGRATFMLALAGGTAPDVYKAWFHILRHDVDEGFCHPLNEWLGEDADGDGKLSDGEATWPGWRDVPQLWRDVATKDGKVYAVPTPGFAYYGIIYRKDLVKAAGLDPEQPPRTWDAFAAWCEKLTSGDKVIPGAVVQRGQRAFGIENRPWGFLPWVGAAGGDVIRKKGDAWEACFDSPECLRAAEFLKKLIGKGVVRALPQLSLRNEVADLFVQGEIVSVFGGEDLVAYLTENLNFPAEQIGLMPFPAADATCKPVLQAHKHFYAMTEGVGRRTKEERDAVWACVNELASQSVYDETVRKNVAEGRARWCLPADLKRLGFDEHLAEVPPGIRAMYDDLAAGKIKAVTEPYVGFWQAASDLVSRRFLGMLLNEAGKDFDYAAALKSITEDANRGLMFSADKSEIEAKRPLARIICGVVLIVVLICGWLALRIKNEELRIKNGGLSEIKNEELRIKNESDDESINNYADNSAPLSQEIAASHGAGRRAPRNDGKADPITNHQSPTTNHQSPTTNHPNSKFLILNSKFLILNSKFLILNSKFLILNSKFLILNSKFLILNSKFLILNSKLLFLAPAIISIALWSYWPLVRGAVMAFQDYRIVGAGSWEGLDNFIRVASDPNFWKAWARTLQYVGITLVLGFTTPIVLALLLSEIPRGKVFFRTIYFLPHLTSALVVTLMWKMMFDPTENGMLNQLLAVFGIARQAWLQDPAWAMTCCIVPGVWAGAGMASLIYVAALHSLPPDYYEAAAIDGAGIWGRFRHVTLPQLMPLMVINFVGAFIAAFQGMGSIFLLTFGGPGDATNVLSLTIWKEAYNNLRFSTATTMAWFLGVALIGFTYLQIRFLRRVEFRQAAGN